jgi:hypothetical protein
MVGVRVIEPVAGPERVGSVRKRIYDLAAAITIVGAILAAVHYLSGSPNQHPNLAAPLTPTKPSPKATPRTRSRRSSDTEVSPNSSSGSPSSTSGQPVQEARYAQKLPTATAASVPTRAAKSPPHTAHVATPPKTETTESAKATSEASASSKSSGTSGSGTGARSSSSVATPGGHVESKSEVVTSSTSSEGPPGGSPGGGSATGEASGTASGEASFSAEH